MQKWGFEYKENDQFVPLGIAIYESDIVYVADSKRNILKFDSQGNFLQKWKYDVPYPKYPVSIFSPVGLISDSANNIYLTSNEFAGFQKFSSEGKFLMQLNEYGSNDGQFGNRVILTTDTDDNIYVADVQGDRIQKFDSDGKFLLKWTKDTSPNEDEQTWGIATDNNNFIYVLEYSENNNPIQKFDSNGKYLGRIDMPVLQEGNFKHYTGIILDNENNILMIQYSRQIY